MAFQPWQQAVVVAAAAPQAVAFMVESLSRNDCEVYGVVELGRQERTACLENAECSPMHGLRGVYCMQFELGVVCYSGQEYGLAVLVSLDEAMGVNFVGQRMEKQYPPCCYKPGVLLKYVYC